ncbi:MAG: type I-C CRISPR-associated protein Cas8c/Csd1 [Hyphomicrobiales bacterium]|nr:type I-C CRISPR-associated protein Cas8c/Csd1 [Hyphomicrobiales bacterium]
MTILASLVRAYDRLGDKAPAQGFSTEKIGFVIPLNEDGSPVGKPIDLREGEGKKKTSRLIAVPQAVKRTSGVAANFLWDKTAYVLGVTAAEGKTPIKEHQCFRDAHFDRLGNIDDPGLLALRRFLENWKLEEFVRLQWPDDMKDQNVIFALECDRRANLWLHDRPAARALWTNLQASGAATHAVCLVTGEKAPIARLHPAIKGVWGAQSSGASLVSFNLDAFTSYGHEQGDNAPVSEAATFAYTTALNLFLQKGSGHRMQIGDASTVYWADASDAATAKDAEDLFADFFEVDEDSEAKKITTILKNVRLGRAPADFRPDLPKNVRFHVLGLAPNAARLAIRFYIEDDFGKIAANFLDHFARMRIEPPAQDVNPPLWRYLVETASQRKSENVPPNLAGEFLRAILTGAPYPGNLLSTLLMRLRADKEINALRVSLLKAILLRNHPNFNSEAPVSLDPANKDPGYLLGRLFATYEYAQSQALGGNVNATIRDQYYGAASATPRAVFPVLQRKVTHHLSRLRKDKPGLAVNLDRDIGEIFELAAPDRLFVPTLTAQRQAMFAIGYYHQRNKFFRPKDEAKTHSNAEGSTK